jgi:hypothetical protein
MMTQADFEEIAEAIREAKRYVDHVLDDAETHTHHLGATAALERATTELATACARRYKGGYGFKRQKFVEACGFPEG